MRIIPGLKDGASIDEAVRLIAQMFKLAGIDEALVDARALIGHALNLRRAQLLSQADRILEAREINAVSALAARRLKHEPVSRILGHRGFWDLDLYVSPDVLVPRPETETVVEAALDILRRGDMSGEAAHPRHRHGHRRAAAGAVAGITERDRHRHRSQRSGGGRRARQR